MRTALVVSFGFVVGGMVGAFAVGTARGGDSSGEWIRVQIENVGTMPLTLRWPDYGGSPPTYYGSSKPPAETMADRFTIEPGVYAWFPRARSGDRIDVQVRAVNGAEPRPVEAKELAGVKSLLVGWEKNAAVQSKGDSCVATGFAYLLRSAGALGIDYAKFEDEFDLGALNDYPTVARAIERKYPDVRFAWSHFKSSEESMQFIERSIDEGRPIVLGLRGSATSTHIVPVLGYDDKWVYYLNYAHADGTKDVRAIRRWELARRDQEWTPSTCQTAWLETRWPPGAYKEDTREAAKLERRADPAAEELFQRFANLVHYPATEGWKSVTGKGDAELQGNPYGINPKWTPESGFGVDVTLPQSVKDLWPQPCPSEESIAVATLAGLTSRGANTPFDLPAGWRNREHFNVTLRQDGDDQVVEMTPFDDKADAQLRQYVFGKDGLLKNSSIELKSSPTGQEGTRWEVVWRFKKKGERYVIKWIKISDRARARAYGAKFNYYDGPNGSALLEEITFWDRIQGEGNVIRFHDYVVDGKLVESTEAPPDGEAKPAETPPLPKTDK